ncbi:MAG: hypothetical protein M0R80_28840 [Proteobacteria bacterium]|nr:hypothetical protein [Pseudomonadota bacterium]
MQGNRFALLSLLVFSMVCFAGNAVAQSSDEVSGESGPFNDPAETVPYYEEYVNDEPEAFAESTCERVEVKPEDEEWYYYNVALPLECDPEFEDCGEDDDGVGQSGGYTLDGAGPQYYNDYPHTCDYDRNNWVRLKSGSSASAGTVASIWMCFGQHYQTYTAPDPDYARPETLWYDDTPSSGQDAACFNLGQGPSTPNTTAYYHFCDYTDWQNFFSWLEPDDWDWVRFWTGSSDGLQIEEIEIMHNDQQIYLETGVNYWMDVYYGRQLFLDWRIAKYKHDLVAAKVGGSHMNPILEVAAQDLGHSGARKYVSEDRAWCSEFAVYAIQHGSKLSSACPGIPTPLVTGGISIPSDMEPWFSGCGRKISYASVIANPSLLKPGYYLSWNDQGHSVIFVGWAGTPGSGDIWVIDGNGHGWNSVRLNTRPWSEFKTSDFAGNTF